jgi:cell pole-organizing protein PopZ
MADRQGGEMSMEDILSSIRKYVSEESGQDAAEHVRPEDPHMDDEIRLGAEQIVDHSTGEMYSDASRLVSDFGGQVHEGYDDGKDRRAGPFDKLTEALRAYGKSGRHRHRPREDGAAAVYELFVTIASDLVDQWIKQNLPRITEELVMREIERLKS